ncbi:MAG: aldehyde dehydrogenase family protein [Deltaproteobacteria bacterium]|nr:MAG: aldehyde dehydrogenase family protein [Deltaproteobacteria bacterium]
MREGLRLYIDGEWVEPIESRVIEVINPATEEAFGRVSLGSTADVDRAVTAAKAAFATYSQTSKANRIALLERVIACYQERLDGLAETISLEMGAPMSLATSAQAPMGLTQLNTALEVLKDYEFQQTRGNTLIIKEPIGVCGFITPWNWPMNQIMCKVAPALAAGCTIVLKPSEVTPLSAILLADIMDAADVPAGVFNLINGDGPGVGTAISEHPDIDLVSITGSTRAGVLVAKAAADSVKRVTQELGGKSANIILQDANLEDAITHGVQKCFGNSGQSCTAPSRMFVHQGQHAKALEIAMQVAAGLEIGDPTNPGTTMGPVANESQYDKIQRLIQKGIDEGADLVCGGTGKPEGLGTGYYVKPTVFGNVRNDMTIAREEIFGPVLAILPYETEEEAIALANDSEYGLSGCVYSGDRQHAVAVASQLRTGQVHINGANADFTAPFGGYKKSGNGREWGIEGFEEFLETKALMGAYS